MERHNNDMYENANQDLEGTIEVSLDTSIQNTED